MSPRRSLRRTVLALAAAVALAGCTTWQVETVPQPGATPVLPSRIRVWQRDGTSLLVVDAFVHGDTLRGAWERRGGAPVAVALADIRSVETLRQKQPESTWLALVPIAAIVGAAIFLITAGPLYQ